MVTKFDEFSLHQSDLARITKKLNVQYKSYEEDDDM